MKKEDIITALSDLWESLGFIMYLNDGAYTEAFEMVIEAIESLKVEPCDDCISRQAAIAAFERFIHELGIEDEPYNYGEMALSVKNVPSVAPVQTKTCYKMCDRWEENPKMGRWIGFEHPITDKVSSYRWKCNLCDEMVEWSTAYCPNCGARMEVQNDDAYTRGLEDSWELAKELNNLNSPIPYEIFGLKNENGAYASPLNWDQMITVHEVRERVKEWLDKRRKDVEVSEAFKEIADGLLSLVAKGYKKHEIATVLEAMRD